MESAVCFGPADILLPKFIGEPEKGEKVGGDCLRPAHQRACVLERGGENRRPESEHASDDSAGSVFVGDE